MKDVNLEIKEGKKRTTFTFAMENIDFICALNRIHFASLNIEYYFAIHGK